MLTEISGQRLQLRLQLLQLALRRSLRRLGMLSGGQQRHLEMKQSHHFLPVKNPIRLEEHRQILTWNSCDYSVSQRAHAVQDPASSNKIYWNAWFVATEVSFCYSLHSGTISTVERRYGSHCNKFGQRLECAETPDFVKSPAQGVGRRSLRLTVLDTIRVHMAEWLERREAGGGVPTPCWTRPSPQRKARILKRPPNLLELSDI